MCSGEEFNAPWEEKKSKAAFAARGREKGWEEEGETSVVRSSRKLSFHHDNTQLWHPSPPPPGCTQDIVRSSSSSCVHAF